MWLVVRDGIVIHYPFRDEAAAVLRAHPTLDTVARYDLHQPKHKARNAKSASARRGERMGK